MISRIKKNLDVIIISLCVIALSGIGKILTEMGMAWYSTLQLPAIMPASEVFGVVWSVLYILLACAVVILVREFKHIGYYRTILGFFLLLVILNPLWSYLFFVEHKVDIALLDIIVMEFTLVTIIFLTWHDAKSIALLTLPAALWVAFALYLNYQILILN